MLLFCASCASASLPWYSVPVPSGISTSLSLSLVFESSFSICPNTFRGFYKADGVTVSGLRLEDFKKIVAHIDLKIGDSR